VRLGGASQELISSPKAYQGSFFWFVKRRALPALFIYLRRVRSPTVREGSISLNPSNQFTRGTRIESDPR